LTAANVLKFDRNKELLVHVLVHRQSAGYMAGPVMLIIRDGWGINPGGPEKRKEDGNATLLASTPFHDHLYRDYPWSRLSASAMDVGLPKGQMGNSEVGHLNLGAGRIVYQDLTRINKAIADGELERNRVLQDAFAAAPGHRLHLLGLVSDGGVHSHYSHMIALANAAHAAGVTEIFVHAFTDGRDTSPTGGAGFLRTCENELRTAAPGLSPWSAAITLWIGTAAGTAQKKHGTQSFLVAVNSANHHPLPLWSDNTRLARPTNSCLRLFSISRTNSVSATATRFCFLTFEPTARASSHKRFC